MRRTRSIDAATLARLRAEGAANQARWDAIAVQGGGDPAYWRAEVARSGHQGTAGVVVDLSEMTAGQIEDLFR